MDTTGAGDVFRGAYVTALLEGSAAAGDAAFRHRGRERQLHPRRRGRRRARTRADIDAMLSAGWYARQRTRSKASRRSTRRLRTVKEHLPVTV